MPGAHAVYERAIQIREQALGPTHPAVAQSLNALGFLLHRTGDYDGARPLYERALQIREQTLGPTHPAVAQSLNALAFLHQTDRNYTAAFQQAQLTVEYHVNRTQVAGQPRQRVLGRQISPRPVKIDEHHQQAQRHGRIHARQPTYG
jgi:tetratricopeptide (TPR) repeat protein